MYNYITTKTPKLCPQIVSRVVTLKTDLQLLISIKSTLYASPFLVLMMMIGVLIMPVIMIIIDVMMMIVTMMTIMLLISISQTLYAFACPSCP